MKSCSPGVLNLQPADVIYAPCIHFLILYYLHNENLVTTYIKYSLLN
jgi:hypothetical protein